MQTPSLGQARHASGLGHTVGDDVLIPERIECAADPGHCFELAGPRERIFFDPRETRAGIVTCGGLCPGLNNVIRSLFCELHYGYGVPEVLGFQGGYAGLDPASRMEPVKITPAFVEGIHRQGGTILGTSRGPVDIGRAVDNLISRGINILFTVGGDGTQRGANSLYQEALRRGHLLSVVGVPKTIDNDVAFVSRTFGFFSAVEEAARVLDCAHTEARSTPGGIGLVKLMGRHAGFITAGATVANQDVNFALIPEVPFKLEPFLAALEQRMLAKSHAVIAVAEGAGQDFLEADAAACDASGNVKLKDIGVFLRGHIERHLKDVGLPVAIRYFDPSYLVRSCPANCEDSLLCDLFARNAVHAAMAGKTGVVIGFLHERFIHVPIELLTSQVKRLDPAGGWWRSVLASTGQPACMS
ncbi:ATP-dependent 6-phosphofructokinase [Luteolibacter arcticus]|uniref:ATP-dependent 6-phosphofructokinase n=1 Tax=Luteolibacter arcticus TaxID=1581411 RepID=A0ABT3GCB1_9BACT|nr:ATP-dependent 6-phosphofructokinase [Luteolibacter arcticus]MCW1921270.1 ATP-dependent 6-phosphofructokinase [Luteolibacter arcticus]